MPAERNRWTSELEGAALTNRNTRLLTSVVVYVHGGSADIGGVRGLPASTGVESQGTVQSCVRSVFRGAAC